MTVPKQVADGLKEAVSYHLRKENDGLVFVVEDIDDQFVKNIRHKLSLSQREFSIKFGFSLKTLQNWEAGYRVPEGPARAYLMVISEIPDQVLVAFERASKRRVRHEPN